MATSFELFHCSKKGNNYEFLQKLVNILFVCTMLLTSTAFALDPMKSGTVVIDETQISLILSGDMGGGVGGGVGVQKINLIFDRNLKYAIYGCTLVIVSVCNFTFNEEASV